MHQVVPALHHGCKERLHKASTSQYPFSVCCGGYITFVFKNNGAAIPSGEPKSIIIIMKCHFLLQTFLEILALSGDKKGDNDSNTVRMRKLTLINFVLFIASI